MQGFRQAYGALVISAAVVVLGGCDEDLTSIRIGLDADGSGTVKVITVTQPASLPVERVSSGATWKSRVGVEAVAGTFTGLSGLEIAGIRFATGSTEVGGTLEVSVPLDAERPWRDVIAPIAAGERGGLARTFDPEGKLDTIGASMSLVVECPGEIIASGASTQREGISATHKKHTARLLIPVDAAVPGYDRLVWHVTWQQ